VTTVTLADLQLKLEELSHSESAIGEVQAFSDVLGNTKNRLAVFNSDRGLIRQPIRTDETRALGFDTDDDLFTLLQGDIVSTEAAFYLGERVCGNPKYIVLSSSCDLIPERRECASLLRIKEIRKSEPDSYSKLSLLLKFKRRESMYLPLLPIDDDDVLCNVVQFDGICQIRSVDLLLANRVASLSLVGWRIFGSFARTVIVRANAREGQMRLALEQPPAQGTLDLKGTG
jgi:hypothetical protein